MLKYQEVLDTSESVEHACCPMTHNVACPCWAGAAEPWLTQLIPALHAASQRKHLCSFKLLVRGLKLAQMSSARCHAKLNMRAATLP